MIFKYQINGKEVKVWTYQEWREYQSNIVPKYGVIRSKKKSSHLDKESNI